MDTTIYRPGDSVFHRLNPVTAIVLSVCVPAFAFLVPDARVSFGLAVVLLGLTVVAGVWRLVAKLAAVTVVPMFGFLLVIRGVFQPPARTAALYRLGPVTVWESGVDVAASVAVRVTVFVVAFLLMATTVHPQRMRVALVEHGLPPKVAYVILAGFQTVPQIVNKAEDIATAQRSRGLDTDANLLARFRSLPALMVPLLINALILANTRARALSARGFDTATDPTFLYDVPDPGVERAARWGAVGVVAVTAAWRATAALP